MSPTRAMLALLAALTPLLPAAALATVTGVTLYPDSARVEEREMVRVERTSGTPIAQLRLPLAADPGSLTAAVRTPGAAVADIAAQRVKGEEGPAVAELRKQVDAARIQRDTAAARVSALDAQTAYWTALRPTEAMHPKEVGELSTAMGANISTLGEQRGEAGRELEDKEKELRELEEKLAQATGEEQRAWQARLTLAGEAPAEVEVEFSYVLHGSGWTPAYRIEARPAQAQVEIAFQADVRQNSGGDWKNVPLRLATLPPVVRLDPPVLPEWIVRPRPEPMPRARLMEAAPAPMMDAPAAAPMAKADLAEPVETAKGTYRVWELGARSLAAGPQRRIEIKRYVLPAEFANLLRPAVSEESWLRAKVAPDQGLDLPAGPALYLVDGEVLAREDFTFSGQEAEIFFGSDPLVTAETTTLARASGEKGFLDEKRTQQWKWAITVKNAKTYPVKVRVEEPEPQPRDERIKLEPDFAPQPTVEDQHYVWSLEVPATSKTEINWGVTLKAPKEMPLDLGWR